MIGFLILFLAMIDQVKTIKLRSIKHLNGISKAHKNNMSSFLLAKQSLKMCKYFIEIVKVANFRQISHKFSFPIQYREANHSPSPTC